MLCFLKRDFEEGKEYFTETRDNLYIDTTSKLDFDELVTQFNTIIANIPGSADAAGTTEEGKKFAEYWVPRITEITDKYLGKGKKVNQCSREQVEALDLIVDDLKELTKYKKV